MWIMWQCFWWLFTDLLKGATDQVTQSQRLWFTFLLVAKIIFLSDINER